MNLPNKITLTRIVAVAALVIALTVMEILGHYDLFVEPMIGDSGVGWVRLTVCIFFILASLTDFLDGYIARKYNLVSDLGKFLDPIADKMLVNGLFIFLCFPWSYSPFSMVVPAFCVVIMIVRDLVVDGMRLMAAAKGKVVAANMWGKVKTVAQMVAIPVILLNGWPFSYFDSLWDMYYRIGTILVYVATIASLLSGIIYLKDNLPLLREDKENGNE